jgi:hypothetical protein
MAKLLLLVAACAALGGCYNPRYPADAPGTERPPEGQQPDSNVRYRRDSGAGAGSTAR